MISEQFVSMIFSAAFAFGLAASPASGATASDRLAGDAGLGATPDGRLLLKYAVECALPAGEALRTARKGKQVLLKGSLGLAPAWKHAALSDADQRWMTACILSRVNAFGVTVHLSMRAAKPALRREMAASELRDYTFEEGAFYGNLFADPPVLYACAGTGGVLPAPTKRLRVCTDPDEPGATMNRCGMEMTGSCAQLCDSHDERQGFYRGCKGAGRRYDEVVTIYLKTAH